MGEVQIRSCELASPNGWDVKDFHERYERGLLGLESDASERSVITQTITIVPGQEEGMMHAMLIPEFHSVIVVLNKAFEDSVLLNVCSVVSIESDEQERRQARFYALKWPFDEPGIQNGVGVSSVHR